VRLVPRIAPTLLVAALVAAPIAQASGPTATTAAPAVTTTPAPSGGSAFGPLQGLGTGTTATQSTFTATKRAGTESNGSSTLLLLSIVALAGIAGVGVFIWYEGAKKRSSTERRRRQRMRSGRPGRPAAAMSAGDRGGPPPPPRKRRAQAAKRKKR
jgi:hypothetical protein